MPQLVTLRFDADHRQWSEGQEATFTPEAARQILGTFGYKKIDAAGHTTKVRVARVAEVGKASAPKVPPPKDLRSVRFIRSVPKYSVGMVASFSPRVAERLCGPAPGRPFAVAVYNDAEALPVLDLEDPPKASAGAARGKKTREKE